ncbi:hemin binding protein [Bartonella australis AUST/NH1]|uniref:Hemin binding protein n=1 Tax=Bartonella australis (strain Aust/NH1) TaxID=1094489 RepID=M1N2L2_BARAA|nr:outer membrane beta-barrel protein [Bartonella australis]AGF74154.1 hemin binding protein [Bartonella australis AUST/NH1]
MNMKYLMMSSVVALVSASAAQAADVVVPRQTTSTISPIVSVPSFSWTGFYVGGQIGGFSGKTNVSALDYDGEFVSLGKDFSPKLSGFMGGFYAGSNIDLGSGFILGVDTDIVWANKKRTKSASIPGSELQGEDGAFAAGLLEDFGVDVSIESGHPSATDIVTNDITLKEKWAGATRARLGFAMGRMMPYIAGGVAYTQVKAASLISIKARDGNAVLAPTPLSDDTNTMIGYTLGAGLDFAMTDNIVMRAEYRYSDFGKKKFSNDNLELKYKTNDFRVGVAYKF